MSRQRIIDKSLYELSGILDGIRADKEINLLETESVKLWMKQYEKKIGSTLAEEINEALSSFNDYEGVEEALKDLDWLIVSHQSGGYLYNMMETQKQILHGFCHGIIADGILKDSEVASLSEWLKSNMELTGYYPYDELCTVVRDILRDGKVDDAERKLLKAHLLEYSDLKNKTIINQIQEDTKQINSVGIYTTDAHIEFKEKAFVLSGNFSLGTKSELQSWLESLGGRRTQSVSGKTDYLIVGGGKSDWFYSKHGRKIEAALNLRRAGHQISIIHENDFHDAYQDAR